MGLEDVGSGTFDEDKRAAVTGVIDATAVRLNACLAMRHLVMLAVVSLHMSLPERSRTLCHRSTTS